MELHCAIIKDLSLSHCAGRDYWSVLEAKISQQDALPCTGEEYQVDLRRSLGLFLASGNKVAAALLRFKGR